MQTIYIVEDDDNIRELVLYALESAGFSSCGFCNSEEFYTTVKKSPPDLVLLDIMLPDEDGITVLRKIKASEKTGQIPVIMLTAKGSEYDRIKGLECGADDYVTKPFSVMELISRVKAVLRRSGPYEKPEETYTIGGVELNEDRRTVSAGGKEVTLTYKEFELLCYLMRNETYALSRDKILDEVWGFDYTGETRTVDMHIKTLRHKLGDTGKIIKTVRNVGYKAEEAD